MTQDTSPATGSAGHAPVRRWWLGAGPALLGVVLGLLFALQITPAFNHGQGFGVFVITVACAQVMFGMALAMRPWVIDDLGRDRDIAAAGPAERRWYGVGIAGQGIVISVLLAAQLGIIHASSLPPIEWLTIGVALVMCGWLGTLIQDSRLRSAAGKPPDA